MPEVRLIPLGVGDAFSARHYTTCLALGVDDSWLLIDCPHPVRKMLDYGLSVSLCTEWPSNLCGLVERTRPVAFSRIGFIAFDIALALSLYRV